MKLTRALRGVIRNGLTRIGALEPRGFGLDQLDKRLLKHLDFRGGVFVEAGANDGITQSNTAYFEKYQDWRGILIEPVPHLAAKCSVNRPKSIIYQCALKSRNDPRTELSMTYCNLMSVVDGARGSPERDAAHLESGRQFLMPGETLQRLVVPTRTLDSILQQENVERLDLLSLDVEGFEAEAILGLNFDRIAPQWILVEANDLPTINSILCTRYRAVDQLSHHDYLYKLQ